MVFRLQKYTDPKKIAQMRRLLKCCKDETFNQTKFKKIELETFRKNLSLLWLFEIKKKKNF